MGIFPLNTLVHKVKGYPAQGIIDLEDPNVECYEIERVKFDVNLLEFHNGGAAMEAGMGNYRFYYRPGFSTELPKDKDGKTITFSAGDFVIGEGSDFEGPIKCRIVKIRTFYTTRNKVESLEIWCD